MSRADPVEQFQPEGLLDPARAKISYRSLIACTYQDRGYVVVGTSNRTESLCGFFMPLGDGLWHLGPIAHLYKTEVFALALGLGSAPTVIEQQPSAGLWEGETDLEDLAYWLVNQAPIGAQRPFEGADLELAASIRAHLTFERLDAALAGITAGRSISDSTTDCGLPVAVVERLERLITAARRRKHRPLFTCLNRDGMPS
jgi:NAD+ synthase